MKLSKAPQYLKNRAKTHLETILSQVGTDNLPKTVDAVIRDFRALYEVYDLEDFQFTSQQLMQAVKDKTIESLIGSMIGGVISRSRNDLKAVANKDGRTLTRASLGATCSFCTAKEYSGDYSDAPSDVWQRHKGCDCLIEVRDAKGRLL